MLVHTSTLDTFYIHDGTDRAEATVRPLQLATHLAELAVVADSPHIIYQAAHWQSPEHYSLLQQRAIARLLQDAVEHLRDSHGVILEELLLTPGNALEELQGASGRWELWCAALQEQVKSWVIVDGAACEPTELLQLLSVDLFRDVRLIMRWPTSLLMDQQDAPCWGWERNTALGGLQPDQDGSWQDSSLGVVLPALQASEESYEDIVRLLQLCGRHKIRLRLIPEEVLHCSWQGLGALACGIQQSAEGVRKLAGFVATGGSVLSLQEACCYAEGGEFPDWE